MWPNKCSRCLERHLPCSEPQVSNKKGTQPDGQTAPTPRNAVEDSDDESEVERPIPRNWLQARPKAPGRMPLQDPSSPIRTSRRSSSDTLDEGYIGRPFRRPTLSDIVEDVRPYTLLKDDEIRILTVLPGSTGEDIQCLLVPESLQNSLPFQALSYLWVEDEPCKPITISYNKSASKSKSFKDFDTCRIDTKTNIFKALQKLRHEEHEVRLYVNAICINHEDEDEKHTQPPRTQEIFNKASNVIVWLGVEKVTTQTAFEFIPKVLNMNGFDELVKEDSNKKSQSWDALAELMRNPLFSRRWLIQELAVAKTAVLHCGPYTIPWTSFSDAVALFEANLPAIQNNYIFSLASGGPINDIRALSASTLVSVVSNILRKTPDGKILQRLESVETLVSIMAVFEATNPIDTIIAVMGLAKDGAQIKSIINNKRQVRDKYIDFVGYCARSSRSLDIICRHWAPTKEKHPASLERSKGSHSPKLQLPSWIPNVSGSAFGAPEDKDKDKQSGRIHGDSFVGLPDHRIYNASAGFPPPDFAIMFKYLPQHDGTMFAKGYSLGAIAAVSPRAVKGILSQEGLEMGGWIPKAPTVPERLWRTLVADRGPNNTKSPSWYHRACLHCLEQSGADGDMDTTAILNRPKCSHIVADFLRRVQSVIWNRRFFRGERVVGGERLFGLVPGAAKAGDFVCVLFGCSVPVVLREHGEGVERYYEIVGESFVYGMMDGEAREGLLDEEVGAMTVEFRLR
jgi:hypothetical protein